MKKTRVSHKGKQPSGIEKPAKATVEKVDNPISKKEKKRKQPAVTESSAPQLAANDLDDIFAHATTKSEVPKAKQVNELLENVSL